MDRGSFLLLLVPPSAQRKVREALSEKIHVPFRFDFSGSQIIFCEPEREDYSELERDRVKRVITPFKELETIKKLDRIRAVVSKVKHTDDVEQRV